MLETSGLANYAKANRVNLNPNKRCTLGKRHIYMDGFCACGKMSRREENRLRNKALDEIAVYERGMANAEVSERGPLTDKSTSGDTRASLH